MNKPAPINQTTLRILYYRNKPLIVPAIVFALCFIIIIEAIVPQIQQWFTIHASIANSLQKIDSLNKNITLLSSVSENNLDAKLNFLSQVLPQNKDYLGILSAISQAAIISGTKLGDYSFNVGNLSGNDANSNSIEIRLTLAGGITEAKKFIVALRNQAPLSNLADVQIANNIVTVVAEFYFKPFPTISYETSQNIVIISAQEEALIKSLQSTIQISSGSGALTAL